ncbi:MAG TPA: cupin domain-containing protein [Candidatus Acidoferrales bacterium]|nr:cupin domain-containing protein [Candidatus Acidoferrales bacterium]
MDKFLQLENRHSGEILRMRRMREADGRMVLLLEGTLPPHRNGPPLHIHLQEDEEGHVAAGTLAAILGKKKLIVREGEPVALPARIPHKWWNGGESLLEFNGRVFPVVDFDRYLQATFAVLNASESGRPSLFYMAHIAWRHRHTQRLAVPPAAIQRILIPVILLIGRALGKYRGTSWPGSPESCTGAPEVDAAHARSANG